MSSKKEWFRGEKDGTAMIKEYSLLRLQNLFFRTTKSITKYYLKKKEKKRNKSWIEFRVSEFDSI